jgi:hypothetical protein
MPTTSGILFYFIASGSIVGLHLLGLSVGGSAFPASLDEQFLQGYTNFIIQPLTALAHNELLSSASTLAIWGVTGWVICATAAGIITIVNDWRHAREDITVPREGVVVRHPLLRNLLIRLLWRLFTGILIILFTVLIVPFIRFAFANDIRALNATSVSDGIGLSALSVLVWVTLFHCYVILLRMYVLRTRLFGELLY